ncbi:hypothetical protein ACJX0J_014730, partial [Zea mays]
MSTLAKEGAYACLLLDGAHILFVLYFGYDCVGLVLKESTTNTRDLARTEATIVVFWLLFLNLELTTIIINGNGNEFVVVLYLPPLQNLFVELGGALCFLTGLLHGLPADRVALDYITLGFDIKGYTLPTIMVVVYFLTLFFNIALKRFSCFLEMNTIFDIVPKETFTNMINLLASSLKLTSNNLTSFAHDMSIGHILNSGYNI